MRTSITLAAAAATLLLLVGCAPGDDGDAGAEPAPASEGASGETDADDTPCVVGTWALDVADYSAQVEPYLVDELGIPIEDFGVVGEGTMTFTADGLVAGTITLTTSGTIVAGDTSVPFGTPSSYTASGDWAEGDEPDTIDFENWVNTPGETIDPDGPGVPAIDFTDIPSVGAPCTQTTLVLRADGAPLYSTWHRG